MITKEQALTATNFHFSDTEHHGRVENWRRNGQTKLWKRSPNRFRVPVKYGMYSYGAVTDENAHMLHVAEDCPLNKN